MVLEPSVKAPRSSWPAYVAISADLLSAKAVAWMVTFRTAGQLTPDDHLFFYERYRQLSDWHRARGHIARARRLADTADEHYEAAGGDGPPYAAAMAMPRPSRFTRIDAVGRAHLREVRAPRKPA
jgi:hypothetical protein